MSVKTPCPENITSKTLSAWSDGGLPEAEAARLRAHAEGCPACQERLRTYSEIGLLISGQRIPSAPAVDVAAAAVRAGQRPQPAARHVGLRKRMPRTLWGGLGAAIAAVLLIAAFSQVFANLNRVSPTATVTPAPRHPALAWEQRTLPPGVSLSQTDANFAVSPASSQNAWVCALAPDGKITIWASTDQARSWHVVSHLAPSASPAPFNSCYLTASQGSPQTVAIGLAWTCEQCFVVGRTVNYVSYDAGSTWHGLGLKASVLALATFGASTYASFYDPTSATTPSSLEVIANGSSAWGVLWRDITPPGRIGQIRFLWPDPVSGALLASDGSNHLWRTNDGGANWSRVTFSNNVDVEFGAWLPTAHQWRVCGMIPNTDPTIYCSDDVGKTWATYPPLSLSVTCRDCGKGGSPLVSTVECPPDAVALDGSLLALCQPGPTAKSQTPAVNVYRLAPGVTAWRSLGPVPGSGSAHVVGGLSVTGDPSSSAGALWYIDPAANTLAVATLPS